MVQKKQQQHHQLSLFEPAAEEVIDVQTPQPAPELPEPTVLEFVRARFENGPDMTQEEYKRWIRILVNCSIKRMG